MATINHTLANIVNENDSRISGKIATWTSLTETNNVGDKFEAIAYRDQTVQITGTFGGATITMQGSNDDVTWVTLKDTTGVDIEYSGTNRLVGILQAPRYVRPSISGGSGTSLKVVLASASAR